MANPGTITGSVLLRGNNLERLLEKKSFRSGNQVSPYRHFGL